MRFSFRFFCSIRANYSDRLIKVKRILDYDKYHLKQVSVDKSKNSLNELISMFENFKIPSNSYVLQHIDWQSYLQDRFSLAYNNDSVNLSDIQYSFLDALRKPHKQDDIFHCYMRLMSKLLTFPLTLSYALRRINLASEHLKCNRPLLVLVCGARAESMLPITWWNESLKACENLSTGLHLSFLGPGVLVRKRLNKNNCIFQCNTNENVQQNFKCNCNVRNEECVIPEDRISCTSYSCNSVTMTPITIEYGGLLHQFYSKQSSGNVISGLELCQQNDLILLYNPGLGFYSQRGSKQWAESCKIMLLSMRVIVCTSHGELDYKRDIEFWNEVLREINISNDSSTSKAEYKIDWIVKFQKNPFASLVQELDARDKFIAEYYGAEAAIVTPNEILYSLRLVKSVTL